MTAFRAWRSSTLRGAAEALAKPEKLDRDFLINPHDGVLVSSGAGRKKPKTGIPPVWRFCEGACAHALRP